MIVWRLDKAKRGREDAFSGEGARLYGGRWNEPGVPAVYCSQSLALAALELFVHAGPEGRGLRLVSYEVRIPGDLEVPTAADLPADWRVHPAPASTQRLGGAWLAGLKSAALRVPSVVVPSEHNVVLNPLHADFKRLTIGPARPFQLDARLYS